jgi:hypothetical protein
MPQPARKSIPQATQVGILVESRRRCALCFHLDDDLSVKDGQLAHIDRNRDNDAEDNLVFLCLVHHNQYDTRPSQSKGWLPAELAEIKRRFRQAIAEDRHLRNRAAAIAAGRETDRKALDDLVQTMSDTRTMDFMRDADFGGWSFHWRELNALDEYVQFTRGAEREFIDRDLEALRQKFIAEYEAFRPLLPRYTAPTPWTPTYRTVPVDWRDTQPKRYASTVKMLRAAADKVCAAYDELVRTARERLAP